MAARLLNFDSDARVLEKIRDGGEDALVEIYRKCRKPVMAYVLRNNGRAEDAEDLLQEALVVLWERVRTDRYEHAAKIETFIVATVRNMWLRRLSRMRRERRGGTDTESVPDLTPSVLETMIEDEESGLVRDALETLGDPCRSLLLLYYWEELPMQDIADRLGFANADTVKSKKYQCKKALESLLGRSLGSRDD